VIYISPSLLSVLCICLDFFVSDRQDIGWEEHLRNELFSVVQDVKPQ